VNATPRPPDLGPISPYHLSDSMDVNSDLCFPTILLYPLSSQTDLIAEFPLSSTLTQQLSIVLEDSPSWDVQREYTVDNVDCFMEIEKDTGHGLIKIGKSIMMEKVLKGRIILDGIIRIFVVPKMKAQEWITEWKKHNIKPL
jgi:Cns1/TTC4 Wheel domain